MLRASFALLAFALSVNAEEFVAFRYSQDHVLFFVAASGSGTMPFPQGQEIPEAAARWASAGGVLIKMPLGRYIATDFDGGKHPIQVGDLYTIHLTAGRDVLATVDQLVSQEGCSAVHVGGLAYVRPSDQPAFLASAKRGLDYFLSQPFSPGEIIESAPIHNPIRPVTLSTEEKSALYAVLNSRMKEDLRKLLATPGTYLRDQRPDFWKKRDEALAAGEAQLTIKAQEVDLGGEIGKRYLLKASWTVEDKPAFYIVAWIKPGTAALEKAESDYSRWMRIPELGEDAVPKLDDLYDLLNVFNGGRVLDAGSGYESFGLTVTPFRGKGPIVEYGDGC